MENTNPFTPAGDSASVPGAQPPASGDGPAISHSFTQSFGAQNEPEPKTPEPIAPPNPAPAMPSMPAAPPVVSSWSAPEPVSGGTVPPVMSQPPSLSMSGSTPGDGTTPMPVVQVLSTRGVEYTMMMLTLWLAAGSLLWVMLALFNGGNHFDVMAFPVSLLVVCVPIFAWFFLRLKKAELANPQLKLDPSKRRLTQFTQVIAFAACLFNLIAFVYLLFTKLAGHTTPSLGKDFLNLLVILLVAGGILAYYWNDEHRSN